MRMYTDLCTVKRHTEIEIEEDSETRHMLAPIYENLPCRISQKALGSNSQTDSVNRISYETKLFLDACYEIRQGDVISVTGRGICRSYKAGEPFVYHRHQEILLEKEDYA